MAFALVFCFTLLGSLFELRTGTMGAKLVMATLLIMTPTVFFAIQRVFDWTDKVCLFVGRELHRRGKRK